MNTIRKQFSKKIKGSFAITLTLSTFYRLVINPNPAQLSQNLGIKTKKTYENYRKPFVVKFA
jgi:hypothetical protein